MLSCLVFVKFSGYCFLSFVLTEDVGFINEVIGAHNKYRRIHGCRDLSQCARLRQQAGLYAQELADQGAREPVSDSKVKFGIGENIYISCGNEVTAEEAVSYW
jgi:hypothetical protein